MKLPAKEKADHPDPPAYKKKTFFPPGFSTKTGSKKNRSLNRLRFHSV
jgi:hypothetical protein